MAENDVQVDTGLTEAGDYDLGLGEGPEPQPETPTE
jgi:hypothetical protein